MSNNCPPEGCERLQQLETEYSELKQKVEYHDKQIAKHDTQYAVINTKLSAIIWILATFGAAVITVLAKRLF